MNERATSAFTIVEVLVATLIVSVLVALALPVLGRSQEIRDDLQCISNLRQIGAGILVYAGDHNDHLPGPLLVGQLPYWEVSGGGDPKVLATHLQKYLAVIPTRSKKGGDVFNCPANRRAVLTRPEETPVFMINTEVAMNNRVGPQAPFGYPNTYYADYRYNLAGGILRDAVLKNGKPQDEPPMKLSMLDDIVDDQGQYARSKTWALKDIDQSEPILEREKSSYRTRLPKKMAHRLYRNALFFDFHVGRVNLMNEVL